MPRQLLLEKSQYLIADYLGRKSTVKRSRRSPSSLSSFKRNRLSRKIFAEDESEGNISNSKEVLDDLCKASRKGNLSRKSRRIAKNKCFHRAVLREITNIIDALNEETCPSEEKFSEEKASKEVSDLESLEEEQKPKESLETITYTSSLTGKVYEIPCYDERLLNIAKEFQTKTIEQSCDNDCSSDEELVARSIKKLRNCLLDAIKSTLSVDQIIEKALN